MHKPSLSLVEDHCQVTWHLLSSGVLQTKLKLAPYRGLALTSSPAYQANMLSPYYLREGRDTSQTSSWVSEAAIWSQAGQCSLIPAISIKNRCAFHPELQHSRHPSGSDGSWGEPIRMRVCADTCIPLILAYLSGQRAHCSSIPWHWP